MRLSKHAVGAKDSLIRQMSLVADQVDNPYKLYFGESDMATPEFICRAAYEALQAGHTFYTPTPGVDELREAIAAKFKEVHNVEYSPAQVVCAAGAVNVIFLTIRSLIDPGDNVVIIEPTWPVFASITTLMGAEVRTVPLATSGSEFVLDLDRLRTAIDSRTRMMIINSPGNPTGWMIRREEQEAVWKMALEHDFVILSDEVYDRIVFDQAAAPTFAAVATDTEHLVVVNSFSKTYNMTGWRLGYALANEELVNLIAKLEEFVISNAPAMAQQAGITALRDGEPYVQEIREKYATRRQVAIEGLQAIPQVSLPIPAGGFYAFPKLEGLHDSLAFARKLLLEARVGMAPGIAFGESGEGYMRICFAASEEVLVPALANFKTFIEQNLCD
jgi:aspartate aminotransferase